MEATPSASQGCQATEAVETISVRPIKEWDKTAHARGTRTGFSRDERHWASALFRNVNLGNTQTTAVA